MRVVSSDGEGGDNGGRNDRGGREGKRERI